MVLKQFWATLPRAVCLLVVSDLALVLSLEARGAQADTGRVDAAFTQLIAEARQVSSTTEDDHPAVFTRPHRVVSALQPDDGAEVARRLAGKLTGEIYGDTYIRWHLMPALQDWLHARLVDTEEGTPDPVPADAVKALRSLFNGMPQDVERKWQSQYTPEGRQIDRQIQDLLARTRVKVGVPPFEKTYSGRAALPHITPAKARREAEKIVEQIDALSKKLARLKVPEIERRNRRYREVIKATREYRCDLTYVLIQTGDPKALSAVGSAIANLAGRRQRACFDLTQYTYLAMHDGYLGLYDDRALKSFRAVLRKAAVGTQRYEVYLRGDKPVQAYVRPKMRSFGSYAAHLIDTLEDPDSIRRFTLTTDRSEDSAAPVPVGPFDPQTLSIEDVRAAIRAAVDELYTAQRQGDHADAVLPHEGLHHDSEYWYLSRYKKGTPRYQEVVYQTGNHALVCWAMLAAGESYQDPRLSRRISWVLSSDSPFTYDRGMRMLMLSQLSLDRWGPSAKRDAAWLSAAITDKGNFTDGYFGGRSMGWGDHGSGLYGVLGLWGADRLGIELNHKKIWGPIDKHWRFTQQKTPDDQAAGWAVGMLNTQGAEQTGKSASSKSRPTLAGSFKSTVNGPMTAGGVATLTLTERYLNGPRLTDPARDNVSIELRKGLRWLDENFDPAQSPGADWFYYMWTIQRVGQATGRRTFNGVDWFRHVTAEMLNRQGGDGLWEDASGRQGKLLSSGFALLYLANALEPVAVSKLRFDGRWDNRPNDLWNFADYASDAYEVDTTWNIVGLEQPLHELTDSPMLYLATNEPFKLGDAQVDRLRGYIDAGGMLIFNPEAPWGRLSGSVDALVEALFPGRTLEPVAEFHPFYSLHTKLRPTVPMRMVHNGVRPLMVAFAKDIGRGLQTNDPKRRPDSFIAMSNIYLFAVGTEPRRVRLDTSYVAPPTQWPAEQIDVARVRYDGDYDPEPGALTQLRVVMARDQGVDLVLRSVAADELTAERIAFLTTAGGGALSNGQAEALRAWVLAGGTLWLDAAGGTPGAVDAAQAMLTKLFPDRVPAPLDDDSPILTGNGLGPDAHDARRVSYSLYAQRQMGPLNEPRLQAVMINDRPAVIYSPEDLTAALAGVGHWGVLGYSTDSARQLAANGILAATR
jgi:Domain of unknown function (DUF4159)